MELRPRRRLSPVRLQPLPQLPRHHQPHHAVVTDERPPGMSERSGLIPFHHEMPKPGEAVSNHRPQQRIPRMMQRNSGNSHRYAKYTSREVKHPIRWMRMRLQVENEKLVIAAKFRAGIGRAHKSRLYGDSKRFGHPRVWRQYALQPYRIAT